MSEYLIILLILNIFLFIFYQNISTFYNLFDKPDQKRKIHKISTPLLGGLFIFLNLILYCGYVAISKKFIFYNYFFSNKTLFIFIFLSIIFFIIGYLDDRFNLSANKKLIILLSLIYFSVLFDKNILLNELIFTFTNKAIYLENFSSLFTVLCIALFINAFNMFDGINSQAGLYAIFLFFVLWFVGVDQNLIFTFLIPLIIFIIFNYKGKMFLGNSGSLLLSIILSLILILSFKEQKLYADEIVLLLIFPGLDMLRLFLNRLINHKNPFDADTNHLHHLIIERYNLPITLFLTTIVQGLVFFTYLINQLSIIYFFIFLVFYYLSLYLIFKKKNYV